MDVRSVAGERKIRRILQVYLRRASDQDDARLPAKPIAVSVKVEIALQPRSVGSVHLRVNGTARSDVKSFSASLGIPFDDMARSLQRAIVRTGRIPPPAVAGQA